MQLESSSRPSLEADRRRIFQVAFDEFNATGKWPALDRLARSLVQEMDVHEALADLGSPWINIDMGNERTLELRLPALALCTSSDEVADAFTRTLHLAVKRYFGADPRPEFTQQDLMRELGLNPLRAHQAMVLYKGEPLWSGINGHVPGDWSIKVDNRVRPYRDLKTLQEYVERRYGVEIQAHPLTGARPPQPIVVRPETAPVIFLSHSGSPALVNSVHSMLQQRFATTVQIWSDAQLPGGRWDDNIRAKLGECSALVLVCTPAVLSSVYAGFEIGFVDWRLGQRNVFILRLGVDVRQLQTKPPLSHYQSYNAGDPTDLHLFLTKMAAELGLPAQPAAAVGQQANALRDLASQEAPASPFGTVTENVRVAAPFEVAREDMTAWDRISRVVCRPLGEKGVRVAGMMLMILGGMLFLATIGLLSFYGDALDSTGAWLAIGLYGGMGTGFAGFGLKKAANHRRDRRCEACRAEYGLEEVGTPISQDLPVSGGAHGTFQRTTRRSYKCKNCGHEVTWRWKRTIDPRRI